VARAHAIGVGGAAGALAGGSIVALEAGAGSGLTIAHTLVGALTILVSRVGDHVAVKILGGRILLVGTERIDGIVNDDGGIRARKLSGRGIEITLGGIDVSEAKLANSCWGKVIELSNNSS
jgi:hypothetical protein